MSLEWKIKKRYSIAKPLSGLTSFCDYSKDFETIGYVHFHVVWVWKKKPQKLQLAISFEKEETNFHHSIHRTNFVFKNRLKLTIKNNVPKPEQYSEFFNQVTTINFGQSQSVFWLQSHSMKWRLSVANFSLKDNFDDISTECSSRHGLITTEAFSWNVG